MDLRTGIDLPDRPLRLLRECVVAAATTLQESPRIMTLTCEHGGGARGTAGTVVLPCVAMAPPSLIDFILSRNLADGIIVAGCAESACYHRLGVAWTKQRFDRTRDPYLRARVPRDRVAMIWTSALETRRFEQEVAAFKTRLANLPTIAAQHALGTPTVAPIATQNLQAAETIDP
jgi:coenzyme F420-reducing hydrogenase delta subunit